MVLVPNLFVKGVSDNLEPELEVISAFFVVVGFGFFVAVVAGSFIDVGDKESVAFVVFVVPVLIALVGETIPIKRYIRARTSIQIRTTYPEDNLVPPLPLLSIDNTSTSLQIDKP